MPISSSPSMSLPSNILVATWDMQDGDSAAKQEMTLGSSEESVQGQDTRILVTPNEFKTGGKYRAIVKLQMRFENQRETDERWGMGTGWLVEPDVVVTAGHCVYDHASGMGRAIRINAYIGYSGRDSVSDPNCDVQFRKGLRVATTAGWLASSSNRTSDVSFVKLASPFQYVDNQLISYKATPVKGEDKLWIVGYPGDKALTDKKGNSETGAQMYKASGDIKWDLESSNKHMLDHVIPTGGGQSGSAVLLDSNTYCSIGAHCYGGSFTNQASPIAGTYGSNYDAHIGVVNSSSPEVQKTVKNIKYVSVSALPEQEGFMDVIKDVAKIGSTIASTALTTGSPFLGPVIGPLSAVAGAALGYVGTLCESTMGGSNDAESAIGGISMDPIVRRAILGEAVFQSLDQIQDSAKIMSIGSRMERYYSRNAPGIFKIGPTILHNMISNSKTGPADHSQDNARQEIGFSTAESELDSATTAFRKALLESSPMVGESFFTSSLGDVLVGGIQSADHVDNTAQTGLCYLSSIVAPTNTRVQQTEQEDDLHRVLRRSLCGQAALSAVIDENAEGQLPEGFFDRVKQVVQVIGPRILHGLPKVIEDVTPVITALIQDSGSRSNSNSSNKKGLQTNQQNKKVGVNKVGVNKVGVNKMGVIKGIRALPKMDFAMAMAQESKKKIDVWETLALGASRGVAKDTTGEGDEKNLDGLMWEKP